MSSPEVISPEVPEVIIASGTVVGTDDDMGKKGSREWIFTINNPTDDDEGALNNLDCRYLVYAPEVGKQGTPHFQGYVVFKDNKTRLGVSRLLKRAWLAPRAKKASPQQARRYIVGPYSKDGKEKPINPDAIERGTIPEQGARNDLVATGRKLKETRRERELLDDEDCWQPLAKYPKFFAKLLSHEWKKEADELCASGFTPEVYVLWSRQSGTGKSRFVYDTHGSSNICRGNIAAKTGKLWWDGYDGETVLLLEEFEGQLEFNQWKQLTDRYPIQLEVKGSYCWCVRKRIYFTSNKHPDEWWKLEAVERSQMDRRITKIVEVIEGEPVDLS